MTASYIQTVRTRAVAGREAEYCHWYVTTHIPEVLGIDGFVSAELHRLVAAPGARAELLCIYRLETDDLPALRATMLAVGARMMSTDAMDASATQVDVFERVAA